MNCPQVRDHLPALLYGDLAPAEAAPVEEHLKACTACQLERAALDRLRQALDAVPVPAVAVDVAQVYRLEAERQQRRLRRWRRLAVAAVAAAAAVVVLTAALRLEVRVEGNQVSLRWGAPPAAPDVALAAGRPESRPLAEAQEQLQLLSELLQGLREDCDARDQRRQEALARLQAQLDDLRQHVARRWDVTDADVAALSARSTPPEKGTLP
jgi:hypothetical protein